MRALTPALTIALAGLLIACSAPDTQSAGTTGQEQPADDDPKPDDELPAADDPAPDPLPETDPTPEVDPDPEVDPGPEVDPEPDVNPEPEVDPRPQPPQGEGYVEGQIAENWTLKNGGGVEVSLHDYYGKVIFFEAGSEW